MKYRSRTDIVTTILECAKTGTTKTKIMYKAYLSYTQLTEYLKFLQESELLVYDKQAQLYSVTQKGFTFLTISNRLNDMIK